VSQNRVGPMACTRAPVKPVAECENVCPLCPQAFFHPEVGLVLPFSTGGQQSRSASGAGKLAGGLPVCLACHAVRDEIDRSPPGAPLRPEIARPIAGLVLVTASVLVAYDPVEVVVYVDALPPVATSIETTVQEAACRYIRAEEVPLPVPYTVRLYQRAGESQRYVPRPAPIARGLLSTCPAP
jgi:hypothetical protein